jgi:hypothetical protein
MEPNRMFKLLTFFHYGSGLLKESVSRLKADHMTDIEIIFKTMPKSARSGKLAKIWPSDKKDRKVAEPVTFYVGDGYLEGGGNSDSYSLPSVRESKYESLSPEAALQFFIERCIIKDLTESAENYVEKKLNDWEEDDLDSLEDFFADYLSSEVDPDELGMYELASCGPYSLGIDLWYELTPKQRSEFDLSLVEGEHPGSSFSGVEFHGSSQALNQALAKAGLNMTVE